MVLPRRVAAPTLGDRCDDAQRLLAVARDAFARRYGDDRRVPALVAAQIAVRACSSRRAGEPDDEATTAVRIERIRTTDTVVH